MDKEGNIQTKICLLFACEIVDFTGSDAVAIVVAAIASMIAGAAWYGVFANAWIKAAGFAEPPKQNGSIYVMALCAQVVIACMMVALFSHFDTVSVSTGLISAFFLWLGFCVAPMAVNHRFQSRGWDLTLIDGGYWLLVFLLQGGIIGWLGG